MADIGLIGLAVMGQVCLGLLDRCACCPQQLMGVPYTSSTLVCLRRTLR